MGLRFRKTIPFGNLLRFTVSKSGVSMGVGPRGLNFNIGPRGVRRTVGLPGTGLFYQDTTSWPKEATPAAQPTAISSNTSGAATGFPWFGILFALLFVVILIRACSMSTSAPPTNATQAARITPSAPAAATPVPASSTGARPASDARRGS
jgi:hypothetical protein